LIIRLKNNSGFFKQGGGCPEDRRKGNDSPGACDRLREIFLAGKKESRFEKRVSEEASKYRGGAAERTGCASRVAHGRDFDEP
jgi:hypothetical protein